MADTAKKAKICLDEARLLVLGAQILLGFQYRAFLEDDFGDLPPLSQNLRLASLGLMLLAMGFLMWPVTFHEITEGGHLTDRLLAFATVVLSIGLVPLALSMGIDVYTMARKVAGLRAGLASGIFTTLTAMFFWFALEYTARFAGKGKTMSQSNHPRRTSTPLHEKIDTVLTECRVVIPGSQALLGFQLISILMGGFDRLPASSKYIHLASLLLIALSTILLMAPAAYHRIVERGEDSLRLWRFSRTMLLAAMATLAIGLATEFFVVFRRVTNSVAASGIGAGLALIGFYVAWFGYTLYVRRQMQRER